MAIQKPVNKVVELFNKHSKAVFIGIFSLVGLILIFAGVAAWLYTLPVARVNGEDITRTEYKRAMELAEKSAQFSGDKTESSPKAVLDSLVEDKILKLIAKEKGLSVTDTEVNNQIDSNLESFNNSRSLLISTYEQKYGYSGEAELKDAITTGLLKDKVTNSLIASRDGRFIYTRFNSGNGVEAITGLSSAELDGWAKVQIDALKARLDAGESFDTVYKSAQNDPKYVYPAMDGAEFSGVNSATVGFDKTELAAILATSKGQYSKVIKNETYYGIYMVDSVLTSGFTSWEDAKTSYTEKYVTYGAFGKAYNGDYDIKLSYLHGLFGTPVLAGSCSGCGGCVGGRIEGRVYDSVTNKNIPTVTMVITGSKTFCNGSSTPSAWCGYKTKTFKTNSSTATSGYNYDTVGTDGSSCFANCAGGPFTATLTRTGYTKLIKTGLEPVNHHTIVANFKMTPVKPLVYTLGIDIVPDNAATAVNDGDYNSGTKVNPGFTDVSPTYTSTPVASGDCASPFSTSGLNLLSPQITMTRDMNCIYTFTPKTTFTTTINRQGTGSGTITVSVSPVQTGSDVATFSPTDLASNTISSVSGTYSAGSNYVITATPDINSTLASCAGCNPNPIVEANNTVTVTFTAKIVQNPGLTCKVTPAAGESPLVVKVHTDLTGGAVGPIQYKMDYVNFPAIIQDSKPVDFWYTYSSGGVFTIMANLKNNPLAAWVPCGPVQSDGTIDPTKTTVTVSDPTNSSGGEISR